MTRTLAALLLLSAGCAALVGCSKPFAPHDPFNLKLGRGVHVRDVEHCRFDLTPNQDDGTKMLIVDSMGGQSCKITIEAFPEAK